MRTYLISATLLVLSILFYSVAASAQCSIAISESNAHRQNEYIGSQAFIMPPNASFTIDIQNENSSQAFVSHNNSQMSSLNIDKNYRNYPNYTFTNNTDEPQTVYLYIDSFNSSVKLENVRGMSCANFTNGTASELKATNDSNTMPR